MRERIVAMLSAAFLFACGEPPGQGGQPVAQTVTSSSSRPCARSDLPAPSYSPEEYASYREVVDGSAPEEAIKTAIARRTGRTRAAVDSVLKRVQHEVYFGQAKISNEVVEEQVRCALGRSGRARTVIATGDFVNLGYVDTTPARNDEAIREKVVPRMALVLQALFELPAVQEAQVTLFYPATNGGELKVASVKVRRGEFDASVPVTRYTGFSFVGRMRR